MRTPFYQLMSLRMMVAQSNSWNSETLGAKKSGAVHGLTNPKSGIMLVKNLKKNSDGHLQTMESSLCQLVTIWLTLDPLLSLLTLVTKITSTSTIRFSATSMTKSINSTSSIFKKKSTWIRRLLQFVVFNKAIDFKNTEKIVLSPVNSVQWC